MAELKIAVPRRHGQVADTIMRCKAAKLLGIDVTKWGLLVPTDGLKAALDRRLEAELGSVRPRVLSGEERRYG